MSRDHFSLSSASNSKTACVMTCRDESIRVHKTVGSKPRRFLKSICEGGRAGATDGRDTTVGETGLPLR